MTKQETFNTVAKHLLQQNARSVSNEGECMYRGENGLKCALGVLISDDSYAPIIEGLGVNHFLIKDRLAFLKHNLKLCNDLQWIHDQLYPEDWRDKLIVIGNEHGLDTTGI